MVSKRNVTNAIARAEVAFEWCWEALHPSNHKITEDGAKAFIIEFQPKLLDALFLLDKIYRDIIKERRRLVERKPNLNYGYFRKRMIILKRYLGYISLSINTGKSIGDGFAWVFYKGSRKLLDEHLKLQAQKIMPPGVGGIGERSIIDRMQGFNGLYAISHAMTTMLRLGDVSFYDARKDKIVSVAEAKTSGPENGAYEVTLNLIAGKEIAGEIANLEIRTDPKSPQISDGMRQRLERQLTQMTKALNRAERELESVELRSPSNFHFDSLEEATKNSRVNELRFAKAGKSLLVVAIRISKRRRLFGSFLNSEKFNTDKLAGFEKDIISIALDGSSDNQLIVSYIVYNEKGEPITFQGAIPPASWPVNSQVMHDIIFHRLMVLTMYNPAHLWNEIRNRGFGISFGERGSVKASKMEGGRRIELHNMEYFHRFTSHFLMSDQAVSDMLGAALVRSAEKGNGGAKMNIVPVIEF